MAETAVNFVTETLLRSLANEVRLQLAVKSEVEKISQDLQMIKTYLREADIEAERSNANNMVKDWVRNVREIAHDIEDVIDKYRYEVARRRIEQRNLAGMARRALGFVTRIVSTHAISDEIWEIRERISRQDGVRKSLGLAGAEEEGGGGGGRCCRGEPNSGGGSKRWSWNEQKQLPALLEIDELVGFTAHKRDLVNLLTKGKNITVVPVVGPGGLGKFVICFL